MTVLLVSVVGSVVMAQSNVDPAHKFAWSENIGWTNWRDANEIAQGVNVGATFLMGLIWTENAGWINAGDGTPGALCGEQPCYANLDGTDFGVNVDVDGTLHGYAWGENIGWINFDTAALEENRARFDLCERRFFGFAWGENVGWINLDDAATHVAVGPCVFADADCDGNVAGDDYAFFSTLLSGPGADVDCPVFDHDGDGDVDLLDFAVLQTVFAG
jgi:hypothetical protein